MLIPGLHPGTTKDPPICILTNPPGDSYRDWSVRIPRHSRVVALWERTSPTYSLKDLKYISKVSYIRAAAFGEWKVQVPGNFPKLGMRPPLTACWAQNNTVPWCTRHTEASGVCSVVIPGLFTEWAQVLSPQRALAARSWSWAPALWPPAWLFIDRYSWLPKGSSQRESRGTFRLHLWLVLLEAQHP